MADEYKASRKWSLEEIDELLQDSGMLPRDFNSPEDVEEVAPTPKEAPFNPRPARNENIKHKIISEKVEKSDSVAEPQVYGSFVSEKYREKFFNKPEQNISKVSDKTVVVDSGKEKEYGGFVKKESNFSKTADFIPVSHKEQQTKISLTTDGRTLVFDNDKHTKTKGLRSLAVTDGDAHDIELPIEEEDVQLALEGFHTLTDIEHIDEAQVEAELLEKRKNVVSSFAITSEISKPDEGEEKKLYGTDEYRTADDKFKVKYYLKKRKSSAFADAVVSFICAFVLILLSLLSVVNSKDSPLIIVGYILVICIGAAVNHAPLIDGIKAIKNMKFNKNTGGFIAIVAAIIQAVLLLFSENPFETGVNLLGGASLFALGLNMTGEYLDVKRIIKNFEYIIEEKDIYSINYIEKKETASEVGRGLLIDDPKILSSQKTIFPMRFIELSRMNYPSDKISKKLIPLSVICSVVISIVTLVISKDIRSGVAAFCGCIAVSLPYFSCIADALALTKVSEKLLKKGAMISGWKTLDICENANALAVDSKDVFDSQGGDVFGIHPFYGLGADEAIIYTATLTIASGGPLGNLFKRVIVGETALLPPVDTLTYEDKLGLSAWIFNRRILVGSEDLLRHHNVEIPDEHLIKRHLKDDRYPLYLAIDGKAAAVFIIGYDIDPENGPVLKRIENDNITLLLRSDDANITDSMVAEKLSLHQSGVKVISAVSGDAYKTYIRETTTAADSYLLHDGKPRSFLAAVDGALSLTDTKRFINILQICACGIGLGVVGVLSFVSGLKGFSCVSLVLLQSVFTIVSALIISGGNIVRKVSKIFRIN